LQGQEKYYIKINNIGLWDIQEEKYRHKEMAYPIKDKPLIIRELWVMQPVGQGCKPFVACCRHRPL
jgi:hypothetical protein